MATVIRSEAGKPAKKAATPPAAKTKLNMAKPDPLVLSLPDAVSEPEGDINQYYAVICGEPGIGKTTLGMHVENVLLLTFDPPQKSLRVLQRHVPDWKHFIGYLELLEKEAKSGNFPYLRVLVDGADLWYQQCQKFACRKLMITHPSEAEWGKGWDAVKQTFTGAVDRLMALPCGVWFICHSRSRERELRDGTKAEVLAPILSKGAEEILVGKSDLVINMHYVDGDNRVGIVRGSSEAVAKCRIDGRFMTTDGRQVHEILFGDEGPEKAYEKLVAAFENEQEYATYAEFSKKQALALKAIPKKGGLILKKKV